MSVQSPVAFHGAGGSTESSDRRNVASLHWEFVKHGEKAKNGATAQVRSRLAAIFESIPQPVWLTGDGFSGIFGESR
jgi:hypothetical protein